MRHMRTASLAFAATLLVAGSAVAQHASRSVFGSAVAVAGRDVIATEAENADRPGVIFVYRKQGDQWVEVAQLTASDATPGDQFGRAVAVDGNTMVAGATATNQSIGAAYILERNDAGRWAEVAQLVASDGVEGDALGRAVAIDGDWAFVANSQMAGAVYAFRRSGSSWAEHSKLTGDSVSAGDFFGASLSVSDGWLVVGAPRRDSRKGAAYVFRYDGEADQWTQTAMLTGTGVENNHQFGSVVLTEGGHVMVSAPVANQFTGVVHSFRYDADQAEWTEVGQLAAFDGGRQYRFGSAMAHAGMELWVGAPGASSSEGRAYAFTHDPEAREITGSIKIGSDLDARDFFAGSIALGEDIAVVGVRGDDYGEGTAIIYEREDSGNWKRAAKVFSESTGFDPIVGGEVECAGGAAAQFDCGQVDIVAFLPVSAIGGSRGVRVNDVWGWTDPETGHEYALVGRLDGTAFVDVTDAANPVFVGDLPRTEGSPGSMWRDIKVYKDHAFIVADGAGQHGMQVFDLTRLRDVANAPVTFDEDARYDGIASAHNIVINEESGFAYAVGSRSGGEACGGGLHIINIQEPTQPTFAGCFADPETGRRGTGYTHDAQCVTYYGPDAEHAGHEICFGANETALSIADVTNKKTPVALATASYPNVGYTHQGWLTEDQRYFFMNDELDELQGKAEFTRTLIWDVADLDDPVLVKEHFGTQRSTDHNLYIRGNLMYQSNYVSGLRVLDISDVENPVEVGYFDTVPYGDNSAGFGGSWSNYPFFASGVVVVTSGREGLFILKKRELVP